MSRYIDADKLKKSLSIPSASIIEIGNAIMAQIDDYPTADVRENVKGRWITVYEEGWSGGGFWKCSACGYCYSFGEYFEGDEFNFCPNCGADMRGEA